MRSLGLTCTLMILCAACDEVPDTTGGGGEGGGQGGGDPFASGALLEVPVGDARVYVDLDSVAIVSESDPWDLAFEGADVFTNGGASGSGSGACFGPNDASAFREDTVPGDIPFLIADQSGGPFLDWYVYDGTTHQVYSRYHVFGVERGEERYKVQILSFYGEVEGAPVPAIYQVRSARVTDAGVEETILHADIDGTAGGPDPAPSEKSGCIRLSNDARFQLTPGEANASNDWDLCFRRDGISLNGGTGGPVGVRAVDLMAAASGGETLAEVMELSAETELAPFDDVDDAALTDPTLSYRTDGIVTAFTDKWLEPGADPLAPAAFSWLVAGSDGETPFFVGFESFEGASSDKVGTIALRVKAIGGSLP